MEKKYVAAIALLNLVATCAAAAELPDCKLDHWGESKILERSRPTADSSLLLTVAGKLQNGTALTFARDEPVLVGDLTVSTTRLTLVPSAELRLKSSWVLSFSYRFPAGAPIPVSREVKSDDGRKFLVVRSADNQVLFLDDQGRFCSKALNAKSSPAVWAAGTLSQEPEAVVLEHRVVEEPRSVGAMRIIFNGVGSGQLSFQEVWVNGATVVRSQARNFDQFAREIRIGPFAFEVLAVADGKVTLRYDIPERASVSATDLAGLPLRPAR